jgi:alpha-D-ribose 1-methylphosphonate 5-triphosphate synthase subunit PhnH
LFWQQWEVNRRSYPLGIDVFLFAKDVAIGLPRTTEAHTLEGMP